MTFLAPGYLAVAGGLTLVVLALHFIVTRAPDTVPLPTARFAPDRPIRARARAFKFTDLLLLLCRVGLMLAAGAALAQPIPTGARRVLARIVIADRSGSVAHAAEVRDSVAAVLGDGDVLVPFDSAARSGSISAALIAGLRTAVAIRDRADSLEMVLVSAFGSEELDRATDSIRALWPGAIRLVRVAARVDTSGPPGVVLVTAGDDPLRYALSAEPAASRADVRILRGVAGAADSAWAAEGNRALVLWPEATGAVRDTSGAVSAGDIVVVAPFPRPTRAAPQGRVVARWLDGTPAAAEAEHGSGCIRTVDIPVPGTGDLVLDPRFQRLASRLAGRCGLSAYSTPMDTARLTALAGMDRGPRVPASALGRPRTVDSPLTPWLLAGALGLGVGELFLRRRRRSLGETEVRS